MPKQDKKKKGGARRGPNRYIKKLKDAEGRIEERVRTKKGINPSAREVSRRPSPIGATILNFNGKRVVLECGAEYNTGFLPPDNFAICTKAKGHSTPHGVGNGLENPNA
jgi:hypothetical protein